MCEPRKTKRDYICVQHLEKTQHTIFFAYPLRMLRVSYSKEIFDRLSILDSTSFDEINIRWDSSRQSTTLIPFTQRPPVSAIVLLNEKKETKPRRKRGKSGILVTQPTYGGD
ncbi:unnamed protein product, partial [Ectocarpus sp. 12 AP-2014]